MPKPKSFPLPACLKLAGFLRDLAGSPVNPIQFRMMAHLLEHPDDGPTEIANALHVSRTTVTESFHGLRRLGFAQRTSDPLDERRVNYTLTDSARELLARLSS